MSKSIDSYFNCKKSSELQKPKLTKAYKSINAKNNKKISKSRLILPIICPITYKFLTNSEKQYLIKNHTIPSFYTNILLYLSVSDFVKVMCAFNWRIKPYRYRNIQTQIMAISYEKILKNKCEKKQIRTQTRIGSNENVNNTHNEETSYIKKTFVL